MVVLSVADDTGELGLAPILRGREGIPAIFGPVLHFVGGPELYGSTQRTAGTAGEEGALQLVAVAFGEAVPQTAGAFGAERQNGVVIVRLAELLFLVDGPLPDLFHAEVHGVLQTLNGSIHADSTVFVLYTDVIN